MKLGDTMIRAHYYGTAERVTVQRVGRKWVTASDGRRYDVETLTDEGGGYSLRTPEEHAEQKERARLRVLLRDVVAIVNTMPIDRVRRLIAALEEK